MLACARGERFALRALYEREARWLLAVALRVVRDRERAEDVVQEAFLQVWQHAATFQPALGSARGWVYTLVRHAALKAVREPGRLQAMEPEVLTLLSDQQQARDGMADDRGLDAESLERCLACTPQALRDPAERDALAGEYVLGCLPDDDRAARLALLEREPAWRATVGAWQDRLLGVAVQPAPVDPSPQLPVADTGPVPAGRSLQFWTKPQGAAGPTSLGLVRAGQSVSLPASRLPGVGPQQLFEITLEPENSSPLDRPTGPILYVGRTVAL